MIDFIEENIMLHFVCSLTSDGPIVNGKNFN